MKYPSSNIQAPEKHQASNSKREFHPEIFEAWNLEFLWCLDVGAWSF
jgi:hypothetical protein